MIKSATIGTWPTKTPAMEYGWQWHLGTLIRSRSCDDIQRNTIVKNNCVTNFNLRVDPCCNNSDPIFCRWCRLLGKYPCYLVESCFKTFRISMSPWLNHGWNHHNIHGYIHMYACNINGCLWETSRQLAPHTYFITLPWPRHPTTTVPPVWSALPD